MTERWKQESADFHFPPIEDRARAVYTDVRYVIWRDRGEELINGFDYHRRIRIPGNCSVSFSISRCLKLVYIFSSQSKSLEENFQAIFVFNLIIRKRIAVEILSLLQVDRE